MARIYGYCRISRKEQSIDRQIRNIKAEYPEAHIVQEAFTGTKIEGRRELEKLLKSVKAGDTIVFDSVSRMSRNAQEGTELYFKLFDAGINLIFLKEPHINTTTYQAAIEHTLQSVNNEIADLYIATTNRVLKMLAQRQIALAFEQAAKEVDDLHRRTAEGIETARLHGKQIGQRKGATLVTKKSIAAKSIILEHSKDFGGTLSDSQCMILANISRNAYYRYKGSLRAEMAGGVDCV